MHLLTTDRPLRPLVALLATLLLCFGPAGAAEPEVSPRPLGRALPAYTAPADPTSAGLESPEPGGDLTLRDALAAALRGNPELASLSFEIRSREARALQANLRPNPQLGVEVEDFGGSGDVSGFDASQTTISLAQLVEIGGKRTGRKRVAQAETSLASWDYEARRVAVLTDTTKAFLLVLALQERLDLVHELESLGKESLRSVASTVRSGAVSPIEEDRARVALERVQLEAVRAAKDLEAARVLLAASWGATSASYSRALGDLDRAPDPPALDRLLAATTESPEIARWNAEVEEREARLALARAQRTPDVVASIGGRYYGEGEDLGLVAQLSVPIPLFDRNRGNILDARHRIARAAAERRSAEVSVRSQLESALRSLEAAHAEVLALRDRIIPRATRVYDETRRGYATGLFRYVEVLDAQRTLFEAREDLLTTLTTYHAVATDIERLTAAPLQQFGDTERQ